MTGWRTWSRASGKLSAVLDPQHPEQGTNSLRLVHTAAEDWSLEPELSPPTATGDIIDLACSLRVEGEGSATLCVSTWDDKGNVGGWAVGSKTVRAKATGSWQRITTRIVIPRNIVRVQPRLIGYGPASVWVDDYRVSRAGNISAMRPKDMPRKLQLRNATLNVEFDTVDATLTVNHASGGRTWVQRPFADDVIVQSARIEGAGLRCDFYNGASDINATATFFLDGDAPELKVEIAAQPQATMAASLGFPHPFTSQPGDYLVVPMNEGISYPVDDPTIPPIHLIAYGGHGICMAFYGVTDGERGQMTILETPNDAAIRIERTDGKLVILPQWDSEHGSFGYTRKLRHVFFSQGGHVAMAKRYRAYARQIGLLRTLEEKRASNPNVDLLIGAVNIWCWDRNPVPLVRDLQAAGIERILWSNQQSPENVRVLNDLGVLTSRYDIYQDVMPATNFAKLQWIHPDWTSNAWPNDIILDAQGRPARGWGVEAKDGSLIPCGVICDTRAVPYARERIPMDLATRPYRCRFIDTTTAAPWNECYHHDHPMTRTESRNAKMELLRYVSEDQKLVTGCETGHEAAVPFLHYFEGMLSLGPYRVPDAGRRMSEIWTNVPPDVAKFQLGHRYRLPLWELVFHDCVVAQWYWGDYNNKLPALWDKRDLFNALYGVPPMFMFDRRLWEKDKKRFVQSYTNTCPVVRRVGYKEMLDHRFLTPDRSVQRTTFAGGTTVTVNFGTSPFKLENGDMLQSMATQVRDAR